MSVCERERHNQEAHGPGGFVSLGWFVALVQPAPAAVVPMPASLITRLVIYREFQNCVIIIFLITFLSSICATFSLMVYFDTV